MADTMSLQGRKELTACIRTRYWEAEIDDKTKILDEFICCVRLGVSRCTHGAVGSRKSRLL